MAQAATPDRRRHPHHSARRLAVDILYQADVTGEPVERVLAEWSEAGVAVPAFARELVEGVERQREEVDAAIAQHAQGWTVSRMPAVDRTVLRLACYELLHRRDVPAAAAVSEAVEAAKELSTEESGRFVNGVLGAIARDLPLAPQD